MTTPKLQVVSKSPTFAKGSAYVVGVESKGAKLAISDSLIDTSSIAQLDFAMVGAKALAEANVRVPGPNGSIFLLIGLGSTSGTESLRGLAGAATRALADVKEIYFGLPTASADESAAIFEGSLLARYEFNEYKSHTRGNANQNAKLTVVSAHKPSGSALGRVEILVSAVDAIKNLVNTPARDIYPQSLAAAVQKAAKGTGATVEIWDEKRLATERCGGILAVGAGSSRPPRLVKIDYKPKNAKAHLAFVGKGITFDSGGLSLKPGASMVGMKYDMTGSATVALAVLAIARLQLPIRVTAYMCVAENLVSGTSTRPSDVITMRNGKTVEVINTDAEGRLVLGDGIALASETNPDLIVDVATLTGAASVALGNRHTGLMGSPEAVAKAQAAAEQTGELVWHMPLPAYMLPVLKSDVADIANAKFGANGGMLLGGLFLQEFVGKKAKKDEQIPWAHLDIAPSANNAEAPYGYTGKGATGVMLRTLVALAESYC